MGLGLGVGLMLLQTSLWNLMYWAESSGLQAAAILASMECVLSSVQMQGKSAGLHLLDWRHSKMIVCEH